MTWIHAALKLSVISTSHRFARAHHLKNSHCSISWHHGNWKRLFPVSALGIHGAASEPAGSKKCWHQANYLEFPDVFSQSTYPIHFTLELILISPCLPVVVAALIILGVTSQLVRMPNMWIKDKVIPQPLWNPGIWRLSWKIIPPSTGWSQIPPLTQLLSHFNIVSVTQTTMRNET